MRITSNMMSRNLLQNLGSSMGNLLDLQNELSSGLRVSKPSDDPSGVHNVIGIKANMAMITQIKSNADQASDYMSTTDSTLSNIQSILQRARELAVQGANDTNMSTSRADMAAEVDQITQQVQTLANTKVGNRYIFNGTATDTEPVPSTGSTAFAAYSPIQLDVGNNTKVDVSVNSSSIFGGLLSSGATTGVLDQLSNALPTGTSSQISSTIDSIDACLDNISTSRATLGANLNRITAISSQMQTMSTNLSENLSTIQDADMAKTISDFQTQQNIYQAALSTGAKIIQPSLVDFMK
jgi:flagellar hook-associated protein 3 FlgL